MDIVVSIPEFGVLQPFNPTTGKPWVDQAEADAWEASTRAALTAIHNAQLGPPPTPDLPTLRAAAKEAIDKEAGAARLRYITDVPGQEAVYLRKAEQAKQFKAAGYPASDVPHYIQAEAEATGQTAQAAADGILSIVALWDEQLSPTIEKLRIAAKHGISVATTVEAIDAAKSAGVAALKEV